MPRFALLARLISVALAISFAMGASVDAAPADEKAATMNNADSAIQEFRMEDLTTLLRTMDKGPQRDYFEGVLANRTGDIDRSIQLLTACLPEIQSQPKRAALALEALADDYIRSFRYADADKTYRDLLEHFPDQLNSEQLQGTKDDAAVAHLLREAPRQTIDWQGTVRVKLERNAIGSLVRNMTVNGVSGEWLMDTGANHSVLSRSFAQKLQLTPLPGFSQTMSGLTGIENRLQVAVLPTFAIGGAILHNVVFLILDDANLRIDLRGKSYQINAIIGYPVFQALERITFRHDGWFEAGPATERDADAAAMYMQGLMPVIECGVEGKELPFSFDTGASGTLFSIRYYQRFKGSVSRWKKEENATFGAGGMVRRKVYVIPKLDLTVGKRIAILHKVPVFPTKIGSDKDELFGNLGQDMVANFDSFTLDFSHMTFSLGDPLASTGHGTEVGR